MVENKKKRNNMKSSEEGMGSTRVRIGRFFYGTLAAGYVVCIILQVFFAGLGLLVDSDNWQLHRVFANYFEFGVILMFLLSFFGKIRGGLRWLPLGLFVLTSLQHMTIRDFSGSLRALHTIDALLLFWISMHLLKHSWKWLMPGKKER
ncbi:hypothetical protein J1P26_23500 [Neobacillus sp. MM2021_6]|uniref:DUF6220 domain-containing protein n=1 Tax=Bacillaceae TaxID=186817 RepID=UPI00140BD3C5|nr:hypothetical protein [Neobacillus sp. MM2021_6]NHC21405.1 hypothetical protein [Bacillus sp. MM2020_4]